MQAEALQALEDIDHAPRYSDLHVPLRPDRLASHGLIIEIKNDGVLTVRRQDSGLIGYLALERNVERAFNRE